MQDKPSDASARMSRQRVKDTEPEVALRRELHRRGLRFFVNRRVLPGVRREVDVVFPRVKVAVLCDGCFWHSCPTHRTTPKNNAEFWQAKLQRNEERDRDTDTRLVDAGWQVVRVWEHDNVVEAADAIEREVRSRRGPGSGSAS